MALNANSAMKFSCHDKNLDIQNFAHSCKHVIMCQNWVGIGPVLVHSLALSQQYHNSHETSFAINVFNGLAQDCSNSSALAMELLKFCTKPSY